MSRKLALSLLAGGSLALGGCVPMMAANAIGMAASSARGQPESNEHLKPAAVKDCSAHASQYGAVHIIDVQQLTPSKIIVWGTVNDGEQRRSFECGYGTKITSFKLRSIPSPS